MRGFREKSERSYNKKADNYDNTFDGKFTVKFKNLLLQNLNVSSGDNILDIACGNGIFLKMVSDTYKVDGYGIDISDKMIENAKLRCQDMTFKVRSCENTGFENNYFDVVTVSASYHHFPDVKAFAKEMNRIIKPGGSIYIAEVYLPAIIRAICNPFVPLSKAGDVKFYSPEEIVTNFKTKGFNEKDIRITGNVQIVTLQK